jgi:methyl-galactoside transport system substrate-binding protein
MARQGARRGRLACGRLACGRLACGRVACGRPARVLLALAAAGLAVLLALPLCGCGTADLPAPTPSATPGTREFNVAVLYYDYDDPYVSSIRTALSSDLAHVGIPYEEYDADNSQSNQDQQVDQALQGGASMLVVNIVTSGNAEVSDKVCLKAEAAGVPVVFFNRPVEGEGDEGAILDYYDDVAFVGTDPEATGLLQGELIGTYLAEHYQEVDLDGDGRISYALFKGEAGNPEAIYRTKYAVERANEVLEASGRPDLAYFDEGSVDRYQLDLTGSWSAASAHDYMREDLLRIGAGHGDMIELVIANNDSMAAGAIKALQEEGYNLGTPGSTTIPVFGVDASATGRQLISQGLMAGTVSQDPDAAAECMCSMALNARGGQDLLAGLDSYPRDEKDGLSRAVFIPCSIYEPEASEEPAASTEGDGPAATADGGSEGPSASAGVAS